MVKDRLGIERTETKQNIEIDGALAYADGWIDSQFAQYNQTVPTVVPQQIKDASADLAAFYFYRNQKPNKATIFFDSAQQLIENYLRGQYKKGTAMRRGSERFET